MADDDKRLIQQVNALKVDLDEFYDDCKRFEQELELDQYLEKILKTLDEYGKSIKLVMYPYLDNPNEITALRKKFAQLVQGPRYTESDSALVTLRS